MSGSCRRGLLLATWAFFEHAEALSTPAVASTTLLRAEVRKRCALVSCDDEHSFGTESHILWRNYPTALPPVTQPLNELDSRFRLPQRYSTKDWLSILLQTPRSRVLRRISHPMLVCVIWTCAVWMVQQRFQLSSLTFLPHNLVGSALSLLLVFRTNTAYTRFWEGRQRWQMLSDHVRSLSRFCMLFREQMGARQTIRMARLLCAFPVVLKQYLRGHDNIDASVKHLLDKSDRQSLMRTRNKPLHACNLLAQQIAAVPERPEGGAGGALPFSSRERLAMLAQVAALSDCIGACERIVQTPVPLHYARHTSRLATVFIFTLPLVLAAEMGVFTVPCMAVICWALFGIQEIGLIIEEPFGKMLELDTICKGIQNDVKETLPWAGFSPSSAGASQALELADAAAAAAPDAPDAAGAVELEPARVVSRRLP